MEIEIDRIPYYIHNFYICLDYLWEWAEHSGNWAKLLVKAVVGKEASLSEDELNVVYHEFIQSVLSTEDKTP